MAEFNLMVPGFLLDYRSVTLYQEWLNMGNEGTMADFIAWLRPPAIEAAGIALQAAAAANETVQEMVAALQEAEETAAVWAQQEAAREGIKATNGVANASRTECKFEGTANMRNIGNEKATNRYSNQNRIGHAAY